MIGQLVKKVIGVDFEDPAVFCGPGGKRTRLPVQDGEVPEGLVRLHAMNRALSLQSEFHSSVDQEIDRVG